MKNNLPKTFILDTKWFGKYPNHFGQYILYLKRAWITKPLQRQYSITSLFVLGLITIMYTCTTDQGEVVNEANLNGEELSKVYCGSCHLYPEPALLPKEYWKGVLPRMAPRLGIQTDEYDPYEGKSMQEALTVETAGVFPKEPLLSDTSWQKIVAFYQEKAPDSFLLEARPQGEPTGLFKASFMDLDRTDPPITTLLEIDTVNHILHYGDASGYLYRLDDQFQTTARLKLPSPPVDVKKTDTPDDLLILNVGLLNPNDIETGIVLKTKTPALSRRDLVFTGLARPVDFEVGDLDGDGEEDIVVCHFGFETGKLSWYKKTGDEYEERVLKNLPGASKVMLRDVDGDTDLDIVVLFAQGDEGVSIFYNKKGLFKEERILRVPSIYGSSDFEFLDFDQDGDMDIILANGDNGDKTFILKPYHGVRVYINKGDYAYEERYFFPMYGATKVRARDFDGDGDIDLIASSFFSDYEDLGRKGIAYLENTGDLQFTPHHFPEAVNGRWLVMDAGDIDNDGDEDVVIGSFVQGLVAVSDEVLANWRASANPILFLENTSK